MATQTDMLRAYRMVRTAIKRGLLTRPHVCQRCGAPDSKCSDGRSIIHAHHRDYLKPLDVEWICAVCHRKETPLPAPERRPKNCPWAGAWMKAHPEAVRGSKNGWAKLTEPSVLQIKSMRGQSADSVAASFGVSKWAVRDIWNERSWGHLRAAPSIDEVKP